MLCDAFFHIPNPVDCSVLKPVCQWAGYTTLSSPVHPHPPLLMTTAVTTKCYTSLKLLLMILIATSAKICAQFI